METHPKALKMSHGGTGIELAERIKSQRPFALLPEESYNLWISSSERRKFRPGQALIRGDELPSSLFLVLKGEVRLLVPPHHDDNDHITLAKRGPGQFIGWSSLLRGGSCELVTASTNVEALALEAKRFIEFFKEYPDFRQYFCNLAGPQEAYAVLIAASELSARRHYGWSTELVLICDQARGISLAAGSIFQPPKTEQDSFRWFLSTVGIPNHPVGTEIVAGDTLPTVPGFGLPYRLIGVPQSTNPSVSQQIVPRREAVVVDTAPASLEDLGIIESERISETLKYPIFRGRGERGEALAVLQMVSEAHNTPFRKDLIDKALQDQFRRDKALSLELIGAMCELLGLNTTLAEVNVAYIASLESPSVFLLDGVPVVFFGSSRNRTIVGHPHRGLQRIKNTEISAQTDGRLKVAIVRRVGSTPTSRFGWGWFAPLIRKYKWSFFIVFFASLLAQLFGLAIPLLIQQIIDKVLAQGNLSSLNVIGSAMIVMALFQGVLLSLRTFIFVDTTDRMDLTLGTAVINRLLSLPLTYFEKRPVGEVSQRIGELNNIRSFLTGTALISALNIVFAALYLVVMVIYSPLLTVVALSIVPLYILLVLGIAPIYKHLIRKRAVEQARTQAHLIEVLGGIQTVKAQHFELTARWKWQERYRNFVEEGFKSTVLGSTSREIGNFLNQLSSLLVLWVGMWLVLKGDLTLGMLIAFRIIAGNVTNPILQLSGLYQGFQSVQLSMERLADVVDQTPELDSVTGSIEGQIPMPPISGSIRYEHVTFRFGMSGPLQLDDVCFHVCAGAFVGIVGQSGSGKSTLMKLLPRLYEPMSGRIYIDDYDITKVDLASLRRQIGIVPQDSLLFEGSVSENIALNDPQATSEAIIEAATIACAHDFIMSLEKGYATKLSEKGSNLSGGQRQRIAIARTILMNPMLLVMDEATSALDFETEQRLCENLRQWGKGRTIFFITHRLPTIRNASHIYVMDKGKIVEAGTHDELLEANGRYAVMLRQQERAAS